MSDYFEMIFMVIVFVIICVGGVIFSAWSCATKWSSFETKWGMIRGCQIEVGGKFIPSESYYFKQE